MSGLFGLFKLEDCCSIKYWPTYGQKWKYMHGLERISEILSKQYYSISQDPYHLLDNENFIIRLSSAYKSPMYKMGHSELSGRSDTPVLNS